MKSNPPKTTSPPFQRQRGFTLVELLVVIVIIAVLAGLTFALVGKIKQKAYRATALSSLSQVATFNMAYATENNGNINTYRWPTDREESRNWIRTTFWGRLQPLMFSGLTGNDKAIQLGIKQGIESLFNTTLGSKANPMPKTILAGSRVFGDTSGLPIPFAFNRNLYKFNDWVKLTSQQDPSQVLYMTYGSAHFDEADGRTYEPIPKVGEPVVSNIYYFEDKQTLGVFLDGHIESISAPIPTRRFGTPPP